MLQLTILEVEQRRQFNPPSTQERTDMTLELQLSNREQHSSMGPLERRCMRDCRGYDPQVAGTHPGVESIPSHAPRGTHRLPVVHEQGVGCLLAFSVFGRLRGQIFFQNNVFSQDQRKGWHVGSRRDAPTILADLNTRLVAWQHFGHIDFHPTTYYFSGTGGKC